MMSAPASFNLLLFHVLGSERVEPGRGIASIAGKLGPGARHMLVKNYINEDGFKEWDGDPRFF